MLVLNISPITGRKGRMRMNKDIVVTKLADQKRDLRLCWQATSENEAENLVKYLADHGIEAKTVSISYCKDWG